MCRFFLCDSEYRTPYHVPIEIIQLVTRGVVFDGKSLPFRHGIVQSWALPWLTLCIACTGLVMFKEGAIYPASTQDMAKFDEALVIAACAEVARMDKTPLMSNTARVLKDIWHQTTRQDDD